MRHRVIPRCKPIFACHLVQVWGLAVADDLADAVVLKYHHPYVMQPRHRQRRRRKRNREHHCADAHQNAPLNPLHSATVPADYERLVNGA